jgi:hypothetical protein
MCRRLGKKNKLTALPSARDRGALRTRTMSQHWPVGNFRVGGNTPTIQTPDVSEEPHHRPRRGLRNLAQGRGPQRQVFVAGVKAGVPSDRSSSLGWRTSAHQRTQSWVSCKICLEPRRGDARQSTAVNSGLQQSAQNPHPPPSSFTHNSVIPNAVRDLRLPSEVQCGDASELARIQALLNSWTLRRFSGRIL